MIVHGQIILNQFQHYPNKAVKGSAFAGSLKGAMEMRRHSKLYAAAVKPHRAKGVNANPMRVRPYLLLHLIPSRPACCVVTDTKSSCMRRGSRPCDLMKAVVVVEMCSHMRTCMSIALQRSHPQTCLKPLGFSAELAWCRTGRVRGPSP